MARKNCTDEFRDSESYIHMHGDRPRSPRVTRAVTRLSGSQ